MNVNYKRSYLIGLLDLYTLPLFRGMSPYIEMFGNDFRFRDIIIIDQYAWNLVNIASMTASFCIILFTAGPYLIMLKWCTSSFMLVYVCEKKWCRHI